MRLRVRLLDLSSVPTLAIGRVLHEYSIEVRRAVIPPYRSSFSEGVFRAIDQCSGGGDLISVPSRCFHRHPGVHQLVRQCLEPFSRPGAYASTIQQLGSNFVGCVYSPESSLAYEDLILRPRAAPFDRANRSRRQEGKTMPIRDMRTLQGFNDPQPSSNWLLSARASCCERAIAAAHRVDHLSLRQRQILIEMTKGCLNKQIAYHLGISEKTVKMHRALMLERLQVGTSAEAVRIATEASFAPLLEHSAFADRLAA